MYSKCIIDADSLLYRCGFAAEGEDVSHALHSLKLQINGIKNHLKADEVQLYIKGKGNFREDVAITTVYKGNRPNVVPTHYHALRDYAINVHGAKEVDGMEADDAVSIELYKYRDRDSGVILAAMDKDLWNTPGWHFNYHPNKFYTEYVTPGRADRNFILQLLTGDASDNIPGIPGVGKKTAERITNGLDNKAAMLTVCQEYIHYGEALGWDEYLTRGYLLEQGQLLWMTRELDAHGRPVRWQIPESLFEAATRL